MRHIESTFKGSDGLELFCQSWQPNQPAQSTLTIVHGIGEHGGRYSNLVEPMVAAGHAVFAFDLRGQGRSPGRRGHVRRFAEYRGDVGAFLGQIVSRQHPDLPQFLFGHSLGGLIVLDTVMHDECRLNGIVVSSPALDAGAISPVLLRLSKLLSLACPKLRIPTGLDITGISRDPAVIEAYRNDPLVHGKGTPRLATESMAAMKWCMANANRLRLPVLMFHGSDDRITSPQMSQAFYNKITASDKKYILYDHGFHESLNDIHHQQVAGDIANWLKLHL